MLHFMIMGRFVKFYLEKFILALDSENEFYCCDSAFVAILQAKWVLRRYYEIKIHHH